MDDYGSMILETKRKATEEEPKIEHKKFPLLEFIKITNVEKNINEQTKNFFFYQTPSFLAQKLYNSNQNINDEIVKHINNSLIELKKHINVKTIRESENPYKKVDIVKKILDFDKQQ